MSSGAEASQRPITLACTVTIDRPIEDVFAFVEEPLNDPQWCPKVVSVEQVAGNGPGLNSAYVVMHRPVPWQRPRKMAYTCTGYGRPRRLAWREDDGHDVLDVRYELEPVGSATRLTQHDEAWLGAPPVLHAPMRLGIRRDVQRQLRRLKRILETKA